MAPTVGSLGIGVMSWTTFLPASRSNSKIDGSQIYFGTVGFLTHPSTLISVFANLNGEMNLTFGSLSFRIGSEDSLCLLDPIYSGPLADKTASTATPKSSIGSSSKVNLPVSIKPVGSKGISPIYSTKSPTMSTRTNKWANPKHIKRYAYVCRLSLEQNH
jgi:hypothetical protein